MVPFFFLEPFFEPFFILRACRSRRRISFLTPFATCSPCLLAKVSALPPGSLALTFLLAEVTAESFERLAFQSASMRSSFVFDRSSSKCLFSCWMVF